MEILLRAKELALTLVIVVDKVVTTRHRRHELLLSHVLLLLLVGGFNVLNALIVNQGELNVQRNLTLHYSAVPQLVKFKMLRTEHLLIIYH